MEMLWPKFLAIIKGKNVELPTDVMADISDLLSKEATPAAPAMPDIKIPDISHNQGALNEVVKQMQAQLAEQNKETLTIINALKADNENLLKALGEEKAHREAGQKALEEKAKADKDAKKKALLEAAVKDGRIPAQNAEILAKYDTILEANYEAGEAIIEALPKITAPTDPKTPPIQGANGGATKISENPVASIANPAIVARLESQPTSIN